MSSPTPRDLKVVFLGLLVLIISRAVASVTIEITGDGSELNKNGENSNATTTVSTDEPSLDNSTDVIDEDSSSTTLASSETTTDVTDENVSTTTKGSATGNTTATQAPQGVESTDDGVSTTSTSSGNSTTTQEPGENSTDTSTSPGSSSLTTASPAGNSTATEEPGSENATNSGSTTVGKGANSTRTTSQTTALPSATPSPIGLKSIANASLCQKLCSPPACDTKDCPSFNATCVMDACQCTARFVVFRTNTELLDVTEYCGIRSYTPGTWRLPPMQPIQKPIPVDETNRPILVIDTSGQPIDQGQPVVDPSQQPPPQVPEGYQQPQPSQIPEGSQQQQPQNYQQPQTNFQQPVPQSGSGTGPSYPPGTPAIVQQRLPFALNGLLSALPNVLGLAAQVSNFPIPGFGPASQVANLRPGLSPVPALIGDSEEDQDELSLDDWDTADEDGERPMGERPSTDKVNEKSPSEEVSSSFAQRRRLCQRRCFRIRREDRLRRCISRCLKNTRKWNNDNVWDQSADFGQNDLTAW